MFFLGNKILRQFLATHVFQRNISYCKMSTFVSTVNPVTGKIDWVVQDENYDYHQEIARSAYADMLHDTERNKKYYAALSEAVKIKRKLGQNVNVLDIGTGTGLLSMMAAALGADTVTACEAFEPMAVCAKQIIEQNGFADKIKLIPKRSTEVTVGEGQDMSQRANILVTEVFDTELIGEGAIGTFNHAHRELLEDDCIVVPTASNMYVQLVTSDFVRRWRDLQPIKLSGCKDIIFSPEIARCGGAPSLHDLQLEQVKRDMFDELTDALRVFRFDFSGKNQLKCENQSIEITKCLTSGKVDGIFMWWDLEMDTQGKINLSCAPSWTHPNPPELQWRDHWMQAIYYPSIPVSVQKGEDIKVISNHDEYSLWFNVEKDANEIKSSKLESGPVCTCGAHITFSRSRLGMMNDPNRISVYDRVLQKASVQDKVCMVISDGSTLSLMAARRGAKKVFVIESHTGCIKQITSFVNYNQLQDVIKIIEKEPEKITTDDLEGLKIDLIIGEPFFQSTVLPWHHMYFWYASSYMSKHLSENGKVLPSSMTIKGVAVNLTDLWKIRTPVGICEGFNLDKFDQLIEKSSDIADAIIEPQPLWEYPSQPVSQAVDIFRIHFSAFTSPEQNMYKNSKTFTINKGETCNGLAFWADYDFGDDLVISSGPRKPLCYGRDIDWDYYSRQGVHLLKIPIEAGDKHNVDNANSKTDTIDVELCFKMKTGDVDFTFKSS